MNLMNTASLVIIPIEELNHLKTTQQELLLQLKELRSITHSVPTAKHVTAIPRSVMASL